MSLQSSEWCRELPGNMMEIGYKFKHPNNHFVKTSESTTLMSLYQNQITSSESLVGIVLKDPSTDSETLP